MIRDPSDGSVRSLTNPRGESPSSRSERSVREAEGANINLAPIEADRAARLKKSREWLAKYHAQKGASAISPELDKAIQDELDHPPASILKDE